MYKKKGVFLLVNVFFGLDFLMIEERKIVRRIINNVFFYINFIYK